MIRRGPRGAHDEGGTANPAREDYSPDEMPPRYTELGVRELVRYDPDHAGHRRSKYDRRLFGHFVRNEQGVLIEKTVEGEAVQLSGYPVWLMHKPPYGLDFMLGHPSLLELSEHRQTLDGAERRS